ncbi:Hypothetical protein IALB_1213 [Ignavibacterium album JCM 16511]|uniref:Uncharacterized protein n=1 Tax=Ignavibacterium album (strain DSM 19864 / JCM 16511 / NBRC 101810 / Mat9-16) TaxID=945713 RepID=I0AIW7_IGNAJ|nr:Hypothetical protein IALB_1213 [Ignavibacterium album JCM 16511]
MRKLLCLNSTMVRLKLTKLIDMRKSKVLSQFHYGSIKTVKLNIKEND